MKRTNTIAYLRVSTAERLRDEAREVVGYIADHAGELRETFLERPEVQLIRRAE